MGDKQGHPFRGNQWTDAKITNDVTASYSGQINGTLRAKDAEGRTVAYLDWVKYGDEISISMVETFPEARRQGLGTKLVEKLLEENPDSKLKWGMTTPEGTLLRAKMEATNPRLREQVDRDRRAREYTEREHQKDLSEYKRLQDQLQNPDPKWNPKLLEYVGARLNEIDSRWGSGGVEDPAPGDGPQMKFAPEFPKAGAAVDDREVIQGPVDNASSISSSLTEYRVLPGIREVPMSALDVTKARDLFYSADDIRRTNSLADRIKDSKKISPLIVVNYAEGSYVLEGKHRLAALDALGAKSFPALVVEDLDPETGVEAGSE